MEFQSISSNAFFRFSFSHSLTCRYIRIPKQFALIALSRFCIGTPLFSINSLSLTSSQFEWYCMYLFTFLYLEAYFWSSWMNECTKNYFASKNFRRYICVEILNLSCILYNWLLDFLKLKVHGFHHNQILVFYLSYYCSW